MFNKNLYTNLLGFFHNYFNKFLFNVLHYFSNKVLNFSLNLLFSNDFSLNNILLFFFKLSKQLNLKSYNKSLFFKFFYVYLIFAKLNSSVFYSGYTLALNNKYTNLDFNNLKFSWFKSVYKKSLHHLMLAQKRALVVTKVVIATQVKYIKGLLYTN